MLGHGLERLAVNGEVDNGFIGVVDGVRDGVERDFVGLFIPCQDVVPDLDLADGTECVAFVPGNFGVRAEAANTLLIYFFFHLVSLPCHHSSISESSGSRRLSGRGSSTGS